MGPDEVAVLTAMGQTFVHDGTSQVDGYVVAECGARVLDNLANRGMMLRWTHDYEYPRCQACAAKRGRGVG